ncbi:MAG TPA: hypothetical protein VN688_02630 [Gemmataceae bacterium]|nr:hypothetical protein [Gemmataceae bacterium]
MKPAQWLAVLILALMVGGITFVMVYLNNSNRAGSDTPPAPIADLTFAAKRYPENTDNALTTEVNQTGYHDFWFYNDSKEDLPVGLNLKGCTCSEVDLTLVPESWKPRFLAEAAGRLLQRAPQGLSQLPTVAATVTPERVFPELPEKETKTVTLTAENSVVVPAGAIGWVRLKWTRTHVGRLILFAELWMGQRGGSVSARLDVGVMIAEPMEVNKEISAGIFDIRDLEKGKSASIYCWSVTRPSFRIKAEEVHERGKAESDPIELGWPVPLTSAELRGLEASDKMQPFTLQSGYRIPLTIRAKAQDGTPMDWGHFRRVVRLTREDEDAVPVEVVVTGEVHGDITVGAKVNGRITLGPFLKSRGARGSILLQTDAQKLDLELDSKRLPPYLKVRFPEKPEETAAGHRMWLVEVEVPPNAASGDFPRADNPVYRDSAIYVKTREDRPRSIRIPVVGTANEG